MPHPDTPHADLIARLRARRVRGRPGFYNPDELCEAAADALSRALAEPEMVSLLKIIADVLDVPRNRFGKLETTRAPANEALRKLAVEYKVGAAEDAAHQVVLVARAFLRNRGAG